MVSIEVVSCGVWVSMWYGLLSWVWIICILWLLLLLVMCVKFFVVWLVCCIGLVRFCIWWVILCSCCGVFCVYFIVGLINCIVSELVMFRLVLRISSVFSVCGIYSFCSRCRIGLLISVKNIVSSIGRMMFCVVYSV